MRYLSSQEKKIRRSRDLVSDALDRYGRDCKSVALAEEAADDSRRKFRDALSAHENLVRNLALKAVKPK